MLEIIKEHYKKNLNTYIFDLVVVENVLNLHITLQLSSV